MEGVDGVTEKRFERSNRQIWGGRALVRAKASRGLDAIRTGLKGVGRYKINVESRWLRCREGRKLVAG